MILTEEKLLKPFPILMSDQFMKMIKNSVELSTSENSMKDHVLKSLQENQENSFGLFASKLPKRKALS